MHTILVHSTIMPKCGLRPSKLDGAQKEARCHNWRQVNARIRTGCVVAKMVSAGN